MKIPFQIPFRDKIVFGYSLARTAHFAAQQMTLPVVDFLLTGTRKEHPLQDREKLKLAYAAILDVLKKDSDNIARGLYPVEVLLPESPLKHYLRFPQILADGYSISQRRKQKSAHDFGDEEQEYLDGVPEYYRRNFHFQSGGYLSEKSADLYEHQVEILFSGAADAMRRSLIPLLKRQYPGEGEGLHFLEVAAGTGRLTRFVKLAYPKARITVLDLSAPYLKKARENLSRFSRVDFIEGKAEELPFADETFDAVFSCYLFHELPLEIRREVLAEGHRVLKKGAVYGFVDSVQKGDQGDLEWALEQFPVDFHEPFYKNYTLHPMEELLKEAGFVDLMKDLGFFSKALLAYK